MAAEVYDKLVSNFNSIGLEINSDKTVIFGSPLSLEFLKMRIRVYLIFPT